MPPEEEAVELWLDCVRRDLRAAEVGLAAEPPLTEDAGFHCQQAVEKALKAFLVHRRAPFKKSHDIEYLLDLCVEQDDSFDQLRGSAAPLTVHATRFRYPLPGPGPGPERIRQDLDVARRVMQFVLDRLPDLDT